MNIIKKTLIFLLVILLGCTNVYAEAGGLSLTSQIRLNGVSVGENGMRIIDNGAMSCTIDVVNSSANDDSVTAILATYTRDGTLYKVSTFEIDADAGDVSSGEFTYQFDADAEYSGKLMFWDSMDNFIPLRASIDFTQESGINAYYYNADNRLLQIDKADGKSLIFSYDNMGNLLSKSVREAEESE